MSFSGLTYFIVADQSEVKQVYSTIDLSFLKEKKIEWMDKLSLENLKMGSITKRHSTSVGFSRSYGEAVVSVERLPRRCDCVGFR